MNDYERKKIDVELQDFALRNFEKPAQCKNAEQIRFYVSELCVKIQELENRFNYAPEWAYSLLAQYNARQGSMIQAQFSHAYK